MSNRVDDLETKVSELQAAVNGLTEELVETKERVRQLENTVDVDDPVVRAKQPSEPELVEDEAADVDDAADEVESESEPEDEQRFVDAEEHEQELAADAQARRDEEAKSGEEKKEEKESEQESSDIIVA